jgi:hypothetical protein
MSASSEEPGSEGSSFGGLIVKIVGARGTAVSSATHRDTRCDQLHNYSRNTYWVPRPLPNLHKTNHLLMGQIYSLLGPD